MRKTVLPKHEEDVKKLILKGWSYGEIAKKYGVNRHSVYEFCKRRGWKSKREAPYVKVKIVSRHRWIEIVKKFLKW